MMELEAPPPTELAQLIHLLRTHRSR
jgi:hypothetical protein